MGVPWDVLFDVVAIWTPQRLFLLSFTRLHGDYLFGIQGNRVREAGVLDNADNNYCSDFHVDNPCHLLDRYSGWSAFRPLLLDFE